MNIFKLPPKRQKKTNQKVHQKAISAVCSQQSRRPSCDWVDPPALSKGQKLYRGLEKKWKNKEGEWLSHLHFTSILMEQLL